MPSVVRLSALLLCMQACAYEEVGAPGDPPDSGIGGFAGQGALEAVLDGELAVPSLGWMGEAVEAATLPSDPGEWAVEALEVEPPVASESLVFRELPSYVRDKTWYEERNVEHFGAEGIRVPVRDRRRPRLADLGHGDAVIIEIGSSGCFHHDRYMMVINGGERMHVEVATLVADRQPATSGYDTSEHRVTFELTEDDLEAVGDALGYYRGKPRGGCTDVDSIHIDWRIKGRSPLVEYHKDGSCGWFHGEPSVMPILREPLEGLPRGSLRRQRDWTAFDNDVFF